MRVAVLTIDQRGSTHRAATDRVPDTLVALADVEMLRPFERTAGDEFQGVLDQPAALATVVERLLREQSWSIGIGIGEVEEPLPESTRAGRGPGLPSRPRRGDRGQVRTLAATRRRRRPRRARTERPRARDHAVALGGGPGAAYVAGLEVADLVDAGASYDQAAKRLGVTQSAISQRAQAAGIVEGRRARELVTDLVGGLLCRWREMTTPRKPDPRTPPSSCWPCSDSPWWPAPWAGRPTVVRSACRCPRPP